MLVIYVIVFMLITFIAIRLARQSVIIRCRKILQRQQGQQASASILSLLQRIDMVSISAGMRNFLLQDIYLEFPKLKSLIQQYGFSKAVELASTFDVFELEEGFPEPLPADDADRQPGPPG